MSKETRSLILILGLPFAVAALLLAAGVAWRAVAPTPVYADGAGVDSRNGHAITTLDAGGGVQYLCVSNYAQHGTDPQPRQFLTFYEVQRNGAGKATLYLVGSRCIDFDRGFSELNFDSPKGYGPGELAKALENTRRAKPQKPDRAANAPSGNTPPANMPEPETPRSND